MIEIITPLYEQLAASIVEQCEGQSYHSATHHLAMEGVDYTFRCSLILYRVGGDNKAEIFDVIPVWWEMHTLTEFGEERLNDFDFKTLRDLLCQ